MQTPKSRTSSTEVPQRVSPRATEVPQRVSPRAVRQLKTTGLESDSASSSNQASRTPKNRSPKVVTEHRTPKSPVSEIQKRRPLRASELESQLTQLQDDLKKVKDQLISSESWKKRAQQEAEVSKKQLLDMTSKLEESEKQLLELSASEESRVIELHKVSQEKDRAWQSELEAIQKQNQVDSTALASAMNEVQRLKEMLAESTSSEFDSLKVKLAEALSSVEDLKTQIKDCEESKCRAQELASETLLQLGSAKKTVEALRSEGVKTTESYNSIALELDQSRARVELLEGLVSKLKTGESKTIAELESEANTLEADLDNVKSEVGRLQLALENTEIRFNQEQIQSIVQIKAAYEMVEQMKSLSSAREAELEAEIKKTKADIMELKANLMDKETEIQGISEENEVLNTRIEKCLSCQKEYELESELKKTREGIEDLKANLMDKETEFQNISEENEMLRLEIKKSEMNNGKVKDDAIAEAEAANAREREALVKLQNVTEEVDKSNMKVTRVVEQLEAVQEANSELESELRRIKVQSEQWRKAAEAAAAMLSTGNNGKFVERTGSLDGNYNHVTGRIGSPYSEDIYDDSLKKKNGNMLKKIGVLWKKPQK